MTTPSIAVAVFDQVDHRLLEDGQVGLIFEFFANRHAVKLAIGLRAGRAHRRTLAPIQNAELDAGAIRGQRHGAAERVDFLDQVALADTADRRIAGHLPQGFDVMRQQQRIARPCAQPQARPRCPHARRRRQSHRNALFSMTPYYRKRARILAQLSKAANSLTPIHRRKAGRHTGIFFAGTP